MLCRGYAGAGWDTPLLHSATTRHSTLPPCRVRLQFVQLLTPPTLPPAGSLLGSLSMDGECPSSGSSSSSSSPAASSGSGSYDAPMLAGPVCAAVPLTEDHKPDK